MFKLGVFWMLFVDERLQAEKYGPLSLNSTVVGGI